MRAADLATIVRGLAPVLREYVALQTAGLSAQIVVLEQRLAASEGRPSVPGPKGEPGDSVDVEDLVQTVSAEVQKAVAALPVPRDGKNATVDLEALVTHVASLVPKGEPGQAGGSVTVEDVAPLISAEVMKAVAALPKAKDGDPGKPGESVDLAHVEALVTKAVAALPTPQDGRSVSVDDVTPLISSEVSKAVQSAVSAIPRAKDGIGLAGALIDRSGHLVLTLSDGATKDVGLVVGADSDAAAIKQAIVDEVAKMSRPKDGTDGQDGVGFDDLNVEPVGERGARLTFTKGERSKTFDLVFPVTIYRGVFAEGQAYEPGDQVTYGGGQWIAKAATSAKPDEHTVEGRRDWVLSVKRGREGKPGPPGGRGEPGPKGDKGDKGPERW